MNAKLKIRLLFVAALFVAGCQSQPPVPVDRYYRLPDSALAAAAPWSAGHVAIRELRAGGPYLDRAILYSDAALPTQIQPYHYHHWLYAPSHLIQQHMVQGLARAGLSSSVSDGESGPRPQWVVSGKIMRFEQVAEPNRSSARVELELQLARHNGQPVVRKVYQANVATGDASMDSFVLAMKQALEQIYLEFLNDVRQQRPE